MSSIQRLFELVRKEDVVLWIGAGFSKYAGYPMANELVQIIYSELSDEDKEFTNINKNLQDISEDLFNLRNGSKNQLIDIIRGIYTKEPISTQYHDILASIPHIKTIITTNYDTLIESAYKNKCIKVVTDNDVSLIKENIPSIIKIHGDLSHIEKIVITQSDYTNFYNVDFNTPIWHLVKERISTKTIVFIGYGLEDPNTVSIFDKISSVLKDFRKELFFISPSVTPIKERELIRKGISYINLTGEDFITQLQKNIENNILFDIEKKSVSVDTLNEYTLNKNMFLNLKPLTEGYAIKDIASVNGNDIEHNLAFTISDKEIVDKILNHSSIENIVITPEIIRDFNYNINGLRHPLSDLSKLTHLEVIAIPQETTVSFYIDDKEYTNIPLDFYKIPLEAKLISKLKAGTLTIRIKIQKETSTFQIKIETQHNEYYVNPNDEILFHELYLSLFSGSEIKILTGTGFKFTFSAPNKQYHLEKAKNNLNYFRNLKLIEKHYKVIFEDIKNIRDTDRHNVQLLSNSIKGSLIDNNKDILLRLEFEGLTETLRKKMIEDNDFDFYSSESGIYNLHGKTIQYGYQHIFVKDAIYLNKESFIQGIENKIIIECKANSYFVRYENNNP